MSTHEDVRTGDDTIVAIITPPGEGGVAAVRLAGPDSLNILKRCFLPTVSKDSSIIPFLMRFGRFVDTSGEPLDEILAVFMPSGKSYTGLDQVELFCHGGRQVVQLILEALVDFGGRPAEPGEFTKLAFLNGRIDLAGAEAVAGVIAASTETSYRTSRDHLLGKYSDHLNLLREELISILSKVEASIDFVEEDIDPSDSGGLIETADELISRIQALAGTYTGGKIIREGFKVAICGRPNAGKSSLFNLLLHEERALVNPASGTTRDYLSEWIDLEGFAVNLIDTAGLRTEGDEIEKAGQIRSEDIIDQANLIIWMVDISISDWMTTLKGDLSFLSEKVILLLYNKMDLIKDPQEPKVFPALEAVQVSCHTGFGVNELKKKLAAQISGCMPDLTDGLVVTSARHQKKLSEAIEHLESARGKIAANVSPELIAFDLGQTRNALDEITGRVYTEDVLGEIFSTFCIGK